MTELRRRMLEDLQVRNYSPHTVEVYIRCVTIFARHFGASPDRLGPEHIREYQLFLVQQKRVSWALFNQPSAPCASSTTTTLHQGWMIEHIPYPARAKVACRPESLGGGSPLRGHAEP